MNESFHTCLQKTADYSLKDAVFEHRSSCFLLVHLPWKAAPSLWLGFNERTKLIKTDIRQRHEEAGIGFCQWTKRTISTLARHIPLLWYSPLRDGFANTGSCRKMKFQLWVTCDQTDCCIYAAIAEEQLLYYCICCAKYCKIYLFKIVVYKSVW